MINCRPISHFTIIRRNSNFIIIIPIDNINHTKTASKHTSREVCMAAYGDLLLLSYSACHIGDLYKSKGLFLNGNNSAYRKSISILSWGTIFSGSVMKGLSFLLKQIPLTLSSWDGEKLLSFKRDRKL